MRSRPVRATGGPPPEPCRAPATAVRLRPGEAHVWCAAPQQVSGIASLSPEELHRWSRVIPRGPRRAYAAAHALTRQALSWSVPTVDPSAWRLAAATAHGRPEIVAPRLTEPIRVNLSHATGMVAVVVTLGSPCGVDVEQRPDVVTATRLSRRVLTPAERAAWARLEPAARADRFCRLWTLKEATSKAMGLGLSLPFDSLGFTIDRRGRARRADGDPGWSLGSWQPSGDHHLTVAVQAPAVSFVVHHRQEEAHGRAGR